MKPRRWFQFSIRTMLVLVLLAAIPMGWVAAQLKWMQDRQRAREWIAQHGYNGPLVHSSLRPPLPLIERRSDLPWSLRLLGEEAVPEIRLERGHALSEPEVANIKRLFPESRVLDGPFGY